MLDKSLRLFFGGNSGQQGPKTSRGFLPKLCAIGQHVVIKTILFVPAPPVDAFADGLCLSAELRSLVGLTQFVTHDGQVVVHDYHLGRHLHPAGSFFGRAGRVVHAAAERRVPVELMFSGF